MTDVADGHGGKRPGAGRPEGSPNKVTVELGEAAREFTPLALKTLADICENGTTEQSRIAAATALLDRGYGKPKQVVEPVRVQVAAISAFEPEPVSASLKWLEEVLAEPGGRFLPAPRQAEESDG